MDELKTREAIQDEREARGGLGGHRDRREGRANVWCNKPATSCLAIVLSFLFFSVSHSSLSVSFLCFPPSSASVVARTIGCHPRSNNRHVRWVDSSMSVVVSVWYGENKVKSTLGWLM